MADTNQQGNKPIANHGTAGIPPNGSSTGAAAANGTAQVAEAVRHGVTALQHGGQVTSDAMRRAGNATAEATKRGSEVGAETMQRAGDAASETMRRNTEALAEGQREFVQRATEQFEDVSR